MDDDEFEKYLMNSIVPLFPHAKDKKGHRVLIKVDSGPGRLSMKLLVKLRLLGFVLYPCQMDSNRRSTNGGQRRMRRGFLPLETQILISKTHSMDGSWRLRRGNWRQQQTR